MPLKSLAEMSPNRTESAAVTNSTSSYNAGKRIALLSAGVSAFLAIIKITGGILAHSTALVADGFESASDILTSMIVIGGMTIAQKPPDERFPYGYGRAESLAGKTIATILLVSGALIGYHSIQMLMHPHESLPKWALIPLGLSMIMKGSMAVIKRTTGRRIRSSALEADAANDLMDVLSAIVAATAIGLVLYDPTRFAYADPLGGIGVAAIIFYIGLNVFKTTSSELMDVMPAPDIVNSVRSAAAGIEGVKAVEKCYGRKSGVHYFFDLHVEVDPDMSVHKAHGLSHDVKDAVVASCPFVRDVLVHIEPHSIRTPQSQAVIRE